MLSQGTIDGLNLADIGIVVGLFLLGFALVWCFFSLGVKGKARTGAGRSRRDCNHSADSESSANDGRGSTSELRDWFVVLDVDQMASLTEIVEAYRQKISQYHPDKVGHLGPEFQILAEKKTTEINRAFDIAKRLHRD